MNYFVSDEVPEAWDTIITAFTNCVYFHVQHNKGLPVEDVEFRVKYGLLTITYSGGDHVIDGFAAFAREMSSKICSSCGVPATRHAFGSPKCDQCD